MLTGTDEHGQKIQTVAEKAGKTPQEHVDEMAKMAKEETQKTLSSVLYTASNGMKNSFARSDA